MNIGAWLGDNSWLRKVLRALSVLAALIGMPTFLVGCAGSQVAAYGSGMDSVAVVQNPDINGGRIAPAAMKKIAYYSASCRKQVGAQVAGPVQSAINGIVPYGAAGAVGVGLGASEAFSGVPFGAYAIYGGVATAATGGVNGLVTGSYAMASAVGTCTRDFWDDVVHTDPAFAGTHVEVVYAGKAWGNSSPTALMQSVNNASSANNVSSARLPHAAPATGSMGAGSVTIVPLPKESNLPRPGSVARR